MSGISQGGGGSRFVPAVGRLIGPDELFIDVTLKTGLEIRAAIPRSYIAQIQSMTPDKLLTCFHGSTRYLIPWCNVDFIEIHFPSEDSKAA